MSARTYRGASIERGAHGWWRMSVLVPGGPWGPFYEHGLADTLEGARELVRDALRRAGVTRGL